MENINTIHELMLYITNNMPETPPDINQDKFEKIIKEAFNSEYSLENVWRIAIVYDKHGLNYDTIDKIFIESKNAYYLSEYISAVHQVNQEKIVNMMINTNDKDYINEFLFKYINGSNIEKKYIESLKEYVIK